jgi:hypothetical protein
VMHVPHTPQEPCHGFTSPAPDNVRAGFSFLQFCRMLCQAKGTGSRLE